MGPDVRRAAAALALLVGIAVPGAAQQTAPQTTPSVIAVDTVVAIDQSVDQTGEGLTGVLFDTVVSAGIGRGFEAIVRPIAQRLDRAGGSAEWNRQVWIATLRYQRPGVVGLRVDAGLIPSPVGLANLMLRPHLNPTIALPSALFSALPPAEARAPRTTLLGAVYGYGASATVSGEHWDVRAAMIDTSPMRTRRIFAQPGQNPPRFPTVVAGGGVTPVVGVRVGASITSSGWQKAGETPAVVTDRGLTVVTVESDVSFRYTRLMAEWVRDSLETASGHEVAAGWWLQGQQTLTPRWFASARVERIGAPQVSPAGTMRLHLTSVEETLGVRLTPELTFRVGHRARRGFARPGYDNQLSLSAVWFRRWW